MLKLRDNVAKASELPSDRRKPAPSEVDQMPMWTKHLNARVESWLEDGEGDTLLFFAPSAAVASEWIKVVEAEMAEKDLRISADGSYVRVEIVRGK